MKLNLAAGPWVIEGWTSVDLDPQFKPDVRCDLTKPPYPFNDNTVEFIFCSHMVEHFTYSQAKQFLSECFRILRPGGALRISVPNIRQAINKLFSGEFGSWYMHLMAVEEMANEHPTSFVAFAKEFLYPGLETEGKTLHKSIWDEITLKLFLEDSGFNAVTFNCFRNSKYEAFRVNGLDNRPEHSLFVECEVPA